jgi:hypothetical protein
MSAKKPLRLEKNAVTGNPFAPSERAGFMLRWATLGDRGWEVVPASQEPPAGQKTVCFVRRIEGDAFVEIFHSRKARCGASWVGPLKGWIFPVENAQKGADLVDQVGAHLAEISPKKPGADIANRREWRERLKSRIDEGGQPAWSRSMGATTATFAESSAFADLPCVRVKSPYDEALPKLFRAMGGSWSAGEKLWVFSGEAAIGDFRRAWAKMLRGRRIQERRAKKQQALWAAAPVELPPFVRGVGGETLLADPAGEGVWIVADDRAAQGDAGPERPARWIFERVAGERKARELASFSDKARAIEIDACGPGGGRIAREAKAEWVAGGGVWAPARAFEAAPAVSGRKGRSNPGVSPEGPLFTQLATWPRMPELRAAAALLRAIEGGLDGDAVWASARLPGGAEPEEGPSCVGSPQAGVLFVSKGRFWLSWGEAGRRGRGVGCLCQPASAAFARAWLDPKPGTSVMAAATMPGADPASAAFAPKRIEGLSPKERLEFVACMLAAQNGLISAANAQKRCAAVSGVDPLATMAALERLEILEAARGAQAAAGARQEPADDGLAATAPRRL